MISQESHWIFLFLAPIHMFRRTPIRGRGQGEGQRAANHREHGLEGGPGKSVGNSMVTLWLPSGYIQKAMENAWDFMGFI